MNWIVHSGEALDVLRTMKPGSVDAIITDPPYSSGGMFRGDRAKTTDDKYIVEQGQDDQRANFAGDTRDGHGFAYWCALWLSQCYRLATDGALLAVFTDWRQLPSVTDQIQAGGWVYRGIVPWNKTEATRPQKGWFRAQCEYLVVGAKGKPVMYDQAGKTDAPALPGFYCCPVEHANVHQTQKPVDVMRWLMQLVPKGGTVLDPFCGSGTTGVAALMEGRKFIGVEMVEHFAAISRQRIAEADPMGEQQALAL